MTSNESAKSAESPAGADIDIGGDALADSDTAILPATTHQPEQIISTPIPTPAPVEVESITVELSDKEIPRGTILLPDVIIQPDNATDKEFTLSSSDENILRQIDGQWTAVSAGTAELIATAGGGITGKATVTVVVPVEAVSMGPDKKITVNKGGSLTVTPAITPRDATEQLVRYTSSDESVATISKDGKINAVSVGTAEIRCAVGNVSDTFTLTVIIPVNRVIINMGRHAYIPGDHGSFTVVIGPPDATDKTYEVSINGDAVTLAGDDTFSCNISGESTITVTASNGVSAKQTITVVDLIAMANEVFRLTNAERENEGLPLLAKESTLTQTAQARANEIILHFSHDRPDGRSCFTAYDEYGVNYSWAGENIAMGQNTAAKVVQDWMDSPGHRENIMKSEFGHLGVGVAMDNDGRLYWSQNFTD
jgi:uncharacterized protein YkwD